ncbi:MAG: IS1595 family transposase [Nitrospira sp.]|nr:IS1595 family transposase [Nitrospira sp.]
MTRHAPGKAFRAGISLLELMDVFPTEDAAREWFEAIYWPDGERRCGHCDGAQTRPVPSGKPMPYWCSTCRSYFSVKTGTAMADSKIPLRKWAIGIYLCLTSLKSVSSMKLHRDLKLTQKSAWFMLHRLREAWEEQHGGPFDGPVEVDETYMGGKRKNKPKAKREEATGRGPVDMTAVVGVKDRSSNQVNARVITTTDAETLVPFVEDRAAHGATVYTDDSPSYSALPNMLNGIQHRTVNHSAGEYVREQAHTNGIESFWSMLKRAYKGTFHKMSPKHLQRYVSEFAGKHNIRDEDTLTQMASMAIGLAGKRLKYRHLIADNGLSSGARS